MAPNLGLAEFIVLLVMGFFVLAVLAGVAILVYFLVRKSQNPSGDNYPALLEENRRLRAEIARLKKEQA
jgi:hypothetical protein